MNASTIEALHRINKEFYAAHGREFSSTRSGAWPGWDRVLGTVVGSWRVANRSERLPAVFDAGCGNGRFAEAIVSRWGRHFDYVGIDASEWLMDTARRRLEGQVDGDLELVCSELDAALRVEPAAQRPFDLIVVCGVLHHIAGLATRRDLLERLALRLAPGGLMVISFWQFGDRQRFRRRTIDWHRHNRETGDAVDVEQLEPGDYLLAWGHHDGAEEDAVVDSVVQARRYCHHASPREAARLVAWTGLTVVDRFEADGDTGDLNLYYLLQGHVCRALSTVSSYTEDL